MAAVQLGSKALMSIVKVKENGMVQEFYVVRHNAYTSGRTLLLRRYVLPKTTIWSAKRNTYEGSNLDNSLDDSSYNGSYFNRLTEYVRGQIAAVSIPYIQSYDNWTVANLSRKVFTLSFSEFGGSGTPADGTALANAAELKIATDSSDTAKAQWTRTLYWTTNPYILVRYIDSDGSAKYTGNDISIAHARPAFTLPSTILVDDYGNIDENTAPVITYTGDTNLGEKSEGFTVAYSISDADGDTVTVTEKLDGVTKRTHSPALDIPQQVQAVLPANFQTILNGPHTLTLGATDGKDSAPVDITFTKKVHSCSITLSAPLSAEERPKGARLEILGSIPADAIWTAEVCNNAHDDTPAWENIKSAIQDGKNHIFQNRTKTAGSWGVNFRITVQRGSADNGGYIFGIEGGFK